MPQRFEFGAQLCPQIVRNLALMTMNRLDFCNNMLAQAIHQAARTDMHRFTDASGLVPMIGRHSSGNVVQLVVHFPHIGPKDIQCTLDLQFERLPVAGRYPVLHLMQFIRKPCDVGSEQIERTLHLPSQGQAERGVGSAAGLGKTPEPGIQPRHPVLHLGKKRVAPRNLNSGRRNLLDAVARRDALLLDNGTRKCLGKDGERRDDGSTRDQWGRDDARHRVHHFTRPVSGRIRVGVHGTQLHHVGFQDHRACGEQFRQAPGKPLP
ncbi:hypothetical protein ABW45_08510 [Stenotrophomonas maltophilia]|nr:hypothetical protein ABW45_08510 [Stenotrophomonas maltophilia]